MSKSPEKLQRIGIFILLLGIIRVMLSEVSAADEIQLLWITIVGCVVFGVGILKA